MLPDCSMCLKGRQYVAVDRDPENEKPIDFAWLCVHPSETDWPEFYGTKSCEWWDAKPCEPSENATA